MKKLLFSIIVLLISVPVLLSKPIEIEKSVLKDKIKGGWAGQLIGCTYGGPTEFKFNSTIIPDYHPIEWDSTLIEWWFDNHPGLYDDIYMDLTFVDVFDKQGLDAPADAFAKAFANAEYPLWHANQAARYNILNGIMPPQSGHWLNNPHADDLDFQIEADFAGLMSPGLVNAAAGYCDRIGHIMNYGDGWYGGVYVAAMYSLAFISDDIDFIVNEALKAIPAQSTYYQCMQDVISLHDKFPDDWKRCWFEIEKRWGEDIGCPDGVFRAFNIDAKINSAWILLGLLYGDGDFGKTIDISTRAGDDSDCNPASSGGILGAMIGYSNIPMEWKQGLAKVADRDFQYTQISLNKANELSFQQALQVIKINGGSIEKNKVVIPEQDIVTVPLEIGFEGHYPLARKTIDAELDSETELEFEGIGFALQGRIVKDPEVEHTFLVEMYVDNALIETAKLPSLRHDRRNPMFWRYNLAEGKHSVKFKVLNPASNARMHLTEMIIYSSTEKQNQ